MRLGVLGARAEAGGEQEHIALAARYQGGPGLEFREVNGAYCGIRAHDTQVHPQPLAILCIAIDDQHACRRACPPGFHLPHPRTAVL